MFAKLDAELALKHKLSLYDVYSLVSSNKGGYYNIAEVQMLFIRYVYSFETRCLLKHFLVTSYKDMSSMIMTEPELACKSKEISLSQLECAQINCKAAKSTMSAYYMSLQWVVSLQPILYQLSAPTSLMNSSSSMPHKSTIRTC